MLDEITSELETRDINPSKSEIYVFDTEFIELLVKKLEIILSKMKDQ